MRCAPFLLLFLATAAQAEDLGLRVPKNFKVTLWADHTLANDIYTMALDEKGHVVVSGPGYIRRLEDTDGDGKADKAIDIAKTKTGAMGLLFAQDVLNKKKFVLYATQDGGISEFERTDSSPEFQSFVERALKLPSSEHGGHALRSGPDGSFFAVGGNNSGLGTWDSLPYSPNTKAEAGGFIHFPGWRLTNSKVIAHGFRNPYDFDFTPLGDIITFDSDTERDYLLPWYTPTRVYHVLPGAHHGWRLPGGSRSLARRDFYPDTVAPLANMGRGSPTGVCCYQHTQFPVHYRGGVFLLDWTFGKIHYLPLIPEGSSYQHVTPELFLEAVGNNGFAPTAARVAPDGSLFVSIGGRGTRGAVYRIEYLVNGEFPQIPKAKAEQAIDLVLDAPQPTEAWSQATWVPLVEQISTEELEGVFLEELQPDHRRTRAMDIHVMKSLKALQAPIAQALIRSKSSIVRAHTARFMLDRYGQEDWESLWILTLDESPRVRCEALLCICQICDFRPERRKLADSGSLARCLVDDDRRVRLAACRLLSLLTDTDFSKIERLMKREKSSRGVVSTIVARCWNGPQKTLSKALFLDAAAAYEFAKSPTERVEAIRALMLTLGDWNISNSRVEALCGYTVHLAKPSDRSYLRLVSRELAIELTRRFPSRNEDENMESARLLAMMTSDGEQAYSKVLDQISETSHPTSDFHYLTVLTQLGSRRTSSRTESVANALLALDGKLQRRGLRVESNWYARLRELVLELLKTHPGLDLMLAAHKKLVSPGNVLVAMQLPLETRRAAAIRFFEVIHRDPDFPLSVESIRLLATLPPEKIRPFLRSRWSDRSTRAEIIEQLAQKPEEVDREKFLEFLAT